MTYCNLILEIFQLFSWRCYFLLNSVSSTPSSEPTLSNMWLLQARRRSDLPSAAPQICNISPLHFSASDPQSRRCFHVELSKKGFASYLAALFDETSLFFSFPLRWHGCCMQCFFFWEDWVKSFCVTEWFMAIFDKIKKKKHT